MAPMPPSARCPALSYYGPDAAGRIHLERFTAAHYARHYDARLSDFYPHLLALDNGQGLQACLGFRGAADGPLFLEQYLDDPIEALVRTRLGISIDRAGIVEVGGLASEWAGAGRRLIIMTARWLHGRGFRVVAFTATRCLTNSFRRLHLQPVELGAADPARLLRRDSDWGRYYHHDPRVFAGPIDAAVPGAEVAVAREANQPC